MSKGLKTLNAACDEAAEASAKAADAYQEAYVKLEMAETGGYGKVASSSLSARRSRVQQAKQKADENEIAKEQSYYQRKGQVPPAVQAKLDAHPEIGLLNRGTADEYPLTHPVYYAYVGSSFAESDDIDDIIPLLPTARRNNPQHTTNVYLQDENGNEYPLSSLSNDELNKLWRVVYGNANKGQNPAAHQEAMRAIEHEMRAAGKTNYKIIRVYSRGGTRTLRTNVTLREAQAHCRNPETSSSTATSAAAKAVTRRMGKWYDAYDEM